MPAAEGVFPKADNDPLYGTEASALGMVNVVAGENLTAGNIIYIKKSDGKAYISDTGTADDIRADGIVTNSPGADATAYVQIHGNYVTSGLTANEVYYLGASGAVSTTKSCVEIGVATATTNLFINVVQDDADPIGTVKHILSNITGTPTYNKTAFWILCDGTTISDAESPLNGQPVPDLNGEGRFLRSADTAGDEGGSDTMAHTHLVSGNTAQNAGQQNFASAGTTSSGLHTHGVSITSQAASNDENRPPYHNAVAIIKIK